MRRVSGFSVRGEFVTIPGQAVHRFVLHRDRDAYKKKMAGRAPGLCFQP